MPIRPRRQKKQTAPGRVSHFGGSVYQWAPNYRGAGVHHRIRCRGQLYQLLKRGRITQEDYDAHVMLLPKGVDYYEEPKSCQ